MSDVENKELRKLKEQQKTKGNLISGKPCDTKGTFDKIAKGKSSYAQEHIEPGRYCATFKSKVIMELLQAEHRSRILDL